MSLRAVASQLTRTHMPGLGGVQTRAFAKVAPDVPKPVHNPSEAPTEPHVWKKEYQWALMAAVGGGTVYTLWTMMNTQAPEPAKK
eukprot:jgi/Astpho2/7963/Aster-06560